MEKSDTVGEGDHVLLYLQQGKTWLIKIQPNTKIHTHAGFVESKDIIGKEYGSRVLSNTSAEFVLLKPIMRDFVTKSSRPTQVVYPKDLGAIAAWTDLSPGKIVVESGTGSGSLTCFAANLVRPEGHVYSYEIREDFLKIARKNIERCGMSEYVTLINRDAREGIEQRGVDVAILDVGDPWALVRPMADALRGGGLLTSISPTVNQVEKVTMELDRVGFVDVETLEMMMRRMEVREGRTRPSMRMIGHTAYLTFARRSMDKS